MHSRRKFIQKFITGGAVITAGLPLFNINSNAAQLQKDLLGHGDFQYRVEKIGAKQREASIRSITATRWSWIKPTG